MEISIHALREEGDLNACCFFSGVRPFLSTPSARRATSCGVGCIVFLADFYPRPPRGGRQYNADSKGGIEIFLSTPSARRATTAFRVWLTITKISIHALREEGDPTGNVLCSSPAVFLSTPSARRATFCLSRRLCRCCYFYPRPPRGGRPSGRVYSLASFNISIHALREEGDIQ